MKSEFIEYEGKTIPYKASDICFCLSDFARKYILEERSCIKNIDVDVRDAILVDFGVQQEALLTLISGNAEPSGLLPVQLPANMETVELHCEDKPFDMVPYTDILGNAYDFAFGLNWNGVIQDERTEKYRR